MNSAVSPSLPPPSNEGIQATEECRLGTLEKRLSDKLDAITMKRQSSNKDRATVMIEVSESSPILYMIQDGIRSFERRFTRKSGFALRLICAAIFAFYCIASDVYIQKLPAIEILFVAFLIAFLFNYYLIRDGQVLPYIESEDDNFKAKIAGAAGFASIILFIYSFQHCELTTALYCFALSWIVFAIAESCQKSIIYKINRRQVLFGLLMIILTAIILQPNFSPEMDSQTEEVPLPRDGEIGAEVSSSTVNGETSATLAADSTHFQGVAASLVAGLLFGYMNVCIRGLKNYSFITITHIFTYIHAPFIPVFFPLQKLVSPSLAQWAFLIGLGLAFVFVLQVYIRSLQLESSSKTLLAIPQFIAFITIFSILFGVTIFGQPSIFNVVCSLAILALSYQFSVEIGNEAIKNGAGSTLLPETKNNSKDIPLQTFSKKDNLSLSQKLLDSSNE